MEILQQINTDDLIKEIINQTGIKEFKNAVEKILNNSNK